MSSVRRKLVFASLVSALCGLWTSAFAAGPASAPMSGIVRYPIPGSDFPIANAVEVPAMTKLLYVSGQVPAPADPKAEKYSAAFWGDTTAQATSSLERVKAALEAAGMGLGDVIKMNVSLVAPPGSERMDFAGFMTAYTKFFGTAEQPNLPARAVVQVAGLAAPGMLVEIEVVAAKH